MTNIHTVHLPPPPFINSIDELRSLSTALSTFLSRYDELHNHLNSIKSSIDSKLPNHLLDTPNPNQSTPTPIIETSCDHTITNVSEIMISEQNPNGTSWERSHEIATKVEIPGISSKPEESDMSEEPEETDISEDLEETDTLTKPEEIDDSKKPEETDTSKKLAVSELESCCERMSGRDMKRYVTTHISDMNKLREEIPKALKFATNPAKLVLDGIGRFFLQGRKAYSKGAQLIIVGRLASVLILECFVMMSRGGIKITKEDNEYAAKAAVDWRNRMIREGGLGKSDEVDARGLLLLISGFGIPNTVFKVEDIKDLIRVSNVKEIAVALRRSSILIPRIPDVIDWMVKNNLEIEGADLAYTFGLEDKCQPRIILTKFLQKTIKSKQHGSPAQVREATKKQLSDLKAVKSCLEAHKLDPTEVFPELKLDEKIQEIQKERTKVYVERRAEKSTQKRKEKETQSPRNPKRTRVSSHENTQQEHKPFNHYNNSPYNRSTHNRPTTTDYMSTYSTAPASYGTYGGPSTYPDHQMVNVRPTYGLHQDLALIERYMGQPYSHPSTSGLIGVYNGPRSTLESFPGLLSSSPSGGYAGRGSDLYGFADTVAQTESYRAPRAPGTGTVRSSYLY